MICNIDWITWVDALHALDIHAIAGGTKEPRSRKEAEAMKRAAKSAPGRLVIRLSEASCDVNLALRDATRREALGSQVLAAAKDFETEARDLATRLNTATSMSKDARNEIAKASKPRVAELEAIALRIVSVAMGTDTDGPVDIADGVGSANERLDALGQARRELQSGETPHAADATLDRLRGIKQSIRQRLAR